MQKLNGLTFFKTNEHLDAQLANGPELAFVIFWGDMRINN